MNILHIEDDPDYAALIARQLRRAECGLQIEHAASARQAIQLLEEGTFDAVLLDAHLGDAAGIELVKQVLARAARSPVLILSVNYDSKAAQEYLRLGAQDYIRRDDCEAGALARRIHLAVMRNEVHCSLEDSASELRHHKDLYQKLSHVDPLTMLYNRRGLAQGLRRLTRGDVSGELRSSVLLIDLYDFKEINDRDGYSAGGHRRWPSQRDVQHRSE